MKYVIPRDSGAGLELVLAEDADSETIVILLTLPQKLSLMKAIAHDLSIEVEKLWNQVP